MATGMTLKRIILAIVSAIALIFFITSLINSWKEPQIQSRLELYQTNLLLHAAEWKPENNGDINLVSAQNALIGKDGFKSALNQYEEVLKSTERNLEKSVNSAVTIQLKKVGEEIAVRMGILQVQNNQITTAIKTWKNLINSATEASKNHPSITTAKVLKGLWNEPAKLLPDAESIIVKNLDGWFRYRALTQLYQLQERQEDLVFLNQQEQRFGQLALEKLSIVSGIPVFGFLIGVGLLVFAGIQWFLFGRKGIRDEKTNPVILSLKSFPVIPWDGETILQVMVVGFFLVGQFFVPIGLSLANKFAHFNPSTFSPQTQAFYILVQYSLMSLGGLGVLYLSLKPFFPLPEGLLKIKLSGGWLFWGFGGYFVALPLVILVSLLNQKLWDGRGGSNPILPIALESRDSIALTVFFLTASIAAPIFEEIIFRGFLLPSLTRYVPTWGAIGLSGFLFAIAHLNISEVIPLTTLGIVLGFIYTRSGNLLSSMLLHGLWNSGTLLSLFILGSGMG